MGTEVKPSNENPPRKSALELNKKKKKKPKKELPETTGIEDWLRIRQKEAIRTGKQEDFAKKRDAAYAKTKEDQAYIAQKKPKKKNPGRKRACVALTDHRVKSSTWGKFLPLRPQKYDRWQDYIPMAPSSTKDDFSKPMNKVLQIFFEKRLFEM